MNSVVAVIAARDEEEYLSDTLASLRSQIPPIYKIILINDGSQDDTPQIAKKYDCVVVNLPYHKESYLSTPKLSAVWNKGFEVAEKYDPDFVLISGADHTYPPNYVDRLLKVMVGTDIVMASGIIQGQPIGNQPRGSGRLVNVKYFRHILEMRYPITYGWESYPIYKALSLGLHVQVIKDLVTTSRTLSSSPKQSLCTGRAMRELGYYWPYVLARSLILFLRKPQSGINILIGYISYKETFDFADYVRAMQRHRLPRRVLQICH